MQMLIQILLLIVGFAILIKGADWFVDGASAVAKRFGISQFIIGMTIVAMGTSLPEAAISISAALRGNVGIAVGNVLGSNVLNILLILGISALILPMTVEKSVTRREMPFLVGVSVLLPLLGLLDGELGRIDGVILVILLILYMGWMIRSSVGSPEQAGEEEEELMPFWKACLVIVLGGAMVVLGSNVAVNAATEIARMLHMSDRLIGLTIIALGTSLPELVTSSVAAKKGNSAMALGNVVGSNLFNILFVLGISALITPIAYPMTFLTDSIISCLSSVLLLGLAFFDNKLQRSNGAIMLGCFACYYLWLFMAR